MDGKEKPEPVPFRDLTPEEETTWNKVLGVLARPTAFSGAAALSGASPLLKDFEMQPLPPHFALKDLKIGMGVQEKSKVTDIDVSAFANISQDFNPVHLDDTYAATTSAKERIAHGFLSASRAEALIEKTFGHLARISSCTLKFESPVKLDTELVADMRVLEDLQSSGEIKLALRSFTNGAMVLSGEAILTPVERGHERDVLRVDVGRVEERLAPHVHDSAPASFENLMQRLKRGETTESQERTITHEDLWRFRQIMGSRNPQDIPLSLLGSYFSAIFGTRFPGPGAIYVSQSLNLHTPVNAGSTVTASVTLDEVRISASDRSRAIATFSCACTVDDVVVLDGKAVLMVPVNSREKTT